VTQRNMDDNDLARLLDRTLAEDERGSAVAHLAGSDADAEVLGDAAYLLRELEEEDGVIVGDTRTGHPHQDEADTGHDAKVVPLRPPSTARTWRRGSVRWLALAAVLAGVLLVPLTLSRSGSRAPGDFATLLTSRDAGLPTGWEDEVRWSGTRGGGNVAADPALSARLGAWQVDLEVAANAGQEEATRRFSGKIVAMLGDMQGSGPVAAVYSDIAARAKEPAETLMPSVADARENLVLFVIEDYFSLGAWAEAASLAARRRDAAFFQTRTSRKMLDRAASLSALDEQGRTTVEAIRTAAQADQPNWAVLVTQTDALLSQIAS
jgi:hypothetical protein